jgi:hypothetical protein
MKLFSDLSTFDKTVIIMTVRYNRISPTHSHASSLPLLTIIIIIYVIIVKFVISRIFDYIHTPGSGEGGRGSEVGEIKSVALFLLAFGE